MPSKQNLLGKTFGTLTVVEELPGKEVKGKLKKRTYWRCSCSCGGEVITTTGSLTLSVRSCRMCKTAKCAKDLEGKVVKTKSSGEFKVIKYNDSKNVLVEFIKTGFQKVCQLKEVNNGSVKDPTYPSIYGVGYIGDGEYVGTVTVDGVKKNAPAYEVWLGVIKRCYNTKESFRKKHPAYEGVKVCEEWHNFQNFAKWFYANYPSTGNFELDKDLKVIKSGIYSPQTCSFVPCAINSLFTGYSSGRGMLRGVHWCNTKKKFIVQVHIGETTHKGLPKQSYFGAYDSQEKAESEYIKHKTEHVMKVASQYKEVLDPVVYENITTRTIEFLM